MMVRKFYTDPQARPSQLAPQRGSSRELCPQPKPEAPELWDCHSLCGLGLSASSISLRSDFATPQPITPAA